MAVDADGLLGGVVAEGGEEDGRQRQSDTAGVLLGANVHLTAVVRRIA